MDAVVVDSRPHTDKTLFGCLVETSEHDGEVQRPGTGSSGEVWLGLHFCLHFFCPGIWIYILFFFLKFTHHATLR